MAAVVGVSSTPCNPSRPIPVLHFHGTEDTLVPYDGSGLFMSAAESIQGWVDRNGCTGSPVEAFRNGAAHCDQYSGCEDGVTVTLCTIDGGGHCWPGATTCSSGATTSDIDANAHIFELFETFHLP